MEASTKERLLEAGLAMLLEQGYNHLGIQQLLAATSVPKGSFYHHFQSKEDFALQVIDRYMVEVHRVLDSILGDQSVPPLRRIRNFFEAIRESYRQEGYLGCMLGGLGQELSGISETFRQKVESCFTEIAHGFAGCLAEAKQRGEFAADTDVGTLANFLVNCWEGVALRSRLQRDPAPLQAMLDFYFNASVIKAF